MARKVKSNCLPCLWQLAEFSRPRSVWNQNFNCAAHKHNIFLMNLKKKLNLRLRLFENQYLVSGKLQKNTWPRWVDTRARDTVKWYWSADTLFWQLSMDHNIDGITFPVLRSQLARKYETEHWSRFSKIINWSADSFQINHVTSMSWHMSPRYGYGILVSGYPVLTAVNWPLWMSNVKDVDLAGHAWDTPPFLLIVSPTTPVQSVNAYVRTYARSITWQPKEKRLTIIYGYGALWSPAKN